MTVSELIKELQAIEADHGDKPVKLYISVDAGSLLADATGVAGGGSKTHIWVASDYFELERAKNEQRNYYRSGLRADER